MSASLPAKVRRDLAVLIESEVFGEKTYSICARHTPAGPRRDTYDALFELERQTNRLVDDLVTAHIARPPTVTAARLVGLATAVPAGHGLHALPWRAQLQLTLQTIRPYLAAFTRLSRYFAQPGQRTFYDYVLDHERAIAELAHRELAGRPDALEPVTALLGDDHWIAPTSPTTQG